MDEHQSTVSGRKAQQFRAVTVPTRHAGICKNPHNLLYKTLAEFWNPNANVYELESYVGLPINTLALAGVVRRPLPLDFEGTLDHLDAVAFALKWRISVFKLTMNNRIKEYSYVDTPVKVAIGCVDRNGKDVHVGEHLGNFYIISFAEAVVDDKELVALIDEEILIGDQRLLDEEKTLANGKLLDETDGLEGMVKAEILHQKEILTLLWTKRHQLTNPSIQFRLARQAAMCTLNAYTIEMLTGLPYGPHRQDVAEFLVSVEYHNDSINSKLVAISDRVIAKND